LSAAPSPELSVATVAAWGAWLRKHHASSDGVWLVLVKKSAGGGALDHAKALTVALAWGWIDGQAKGRDARSWLQRFTPRRARSSWSKVNRAKAEALIRAGKMRAPGLAEVERAKRDGRWAAAYDPPSNATVPRDLAAAFRATPRAAAFFAKLDSRNRFAVLYRVQTAKKPETRARRISQFVAMLAKGEKIHP